MRDFLADMNAALDGAVPAGDYVAPVVAAELVERLRTDDPELLAGWLNLRAPSILADVIARRSNSRRQSARTAAPRRAFRAAAESFAVTGEPSALSPFTIEHVVDDANTRRSVARMTAADCRFVAARYDSTARQAKLEAAFHRAVARKVGRRTVGEVFSERQYLEMYISVTGRARPLASAT